METDNSKKASKKYKNILEYLQDEDTEFYGAIQNCCLEFLFNPKGKTGITFLMPHYKKNSEYRNKIIDYSYGLDEEKTSAENMIKSLVIPQNINMLENFKSNSEGIVNSLGQKLLIDLESKSNNFVKLKSGAVLETNKKFRDNSKSNLNIYYICGGEVPTDSPEADLKHFQQTSISSRKKKTKENENFKNKKSEKKMKEELNYDRELRKEIAVEVENTYIIDRVNARKQRSGKSRNIYLIKVLSLVNYLKEYCSNEAKKEILEERIIPMLTFENVDFYVIFEPFGNLGEYLVPSEIIKTWYDYQPEFNIKNVLEYIDEFMNNSQMTIFTKYFQIINRIDSVERENILVNKIPRSSAEQVCELYKKFIAGNSIGNISNVLPESLHSYYKNNPLNKALHDELRFKIGNKFKDIENSYNFDIGRFKEALYTISSYYSDTNLILLNQNTLKRSLAPVEKINEIKMFVSSMYFLYFPLSSKGYAEIEKEFELLEYPSPNGDGIYYPSNVSFIKKFNTAKSNANQETVNKSNANMAMNLLKNLSGQIAVDPKLLSELENLSLGKSSK